MGHYFSHSTTGGGGGGGAVTVADGADVAEGATTDAAVTSDANGTVSGKLRGIVKILADVWDSVNHVLKISGTVTANAGTNLNTSTLALEAGGHLASLDTKLPSQGQALAAASLPVVLTAAQLTTLTPPNPVKSQPQSITSGGATPYHLVCANTTNATSVKGSAGQVYAIAAMNLNASPRYFKLYDKASAPTVGTDTPVHTYMIPGNTAGAGFTMAIPVGQVYALGVAFATTTGIADNDTGAIGSSEVVVNLDYA
jgi:hypothetical protein